MIKPLIDDLLLHVSRLDGMPDSAQLREVLEGALKKIDVVSRSEFDAQAAVLLRLKEKVTVLEEQVLALETQLNE